MDKPFGLFCLFNYIQLWNFFLLIGKIVDVRHLLLKFGFIIILTTMEKVKSAVVRHHFDIGYNNAFSLSLFTKYINQDYPFFTISVYNVLWLSISTTSNNIRKEITQASMPGALIGQQLLMFRGVPAELPLLSPRSSSSTSCRSSITSRLSQMSPICLFM